MKTQSVVILSVFAVFIALEIARTQFFRKPGQSRSDAVQELASTLMIMLLTQPVVFAAVYALGLLVAPEQRNTLESLPFLAAFGLFVVFDDMMQYWWHRASHSWSWLYNLHRAHHDAPYMSVRLVYRNNLLYYWFMPSLWLSGALIFLGLGWVYIAYISIKMTIIIAAHSDVAWDAPLLRTPWLSPVMWGVERVISTPATHHAHHGRHLSDGSTHYKGNFGNMLFVWDVIFGTAKITRRYPESYGVENLPPVGPARLLLWPLVREGKPANLEERTAAAPAE